MSTNENAIGCKTVYTLTAVAHCEVYGVKYAPGQTFPVESQSDRDYLMKAGAVMEESTDPIEVAPAATVPVAAKPPVKRRFSRK